MSAAPGSGLVRVVVVDPSNWSFTERWVTPALESIAALVGGSARVWRPELLEPYALVLGEEVGDPEVEATGVGVVFLLTPAGVGDCGTTLLRVGQKVEFLDRRRWRLARGRRP